MKFRKAVGVCVALASMALMSAAVQAATYSVESKSANKGENVTLSLTAAPNSGSETINGYAFKVKYDANVLTPVKSATQDVTGADAYADNALSSGVFVSDKLTEDGETYVTVAWADASAKTITAETALAELTFAVADDASGSTDLEVTVIEAAQNATTLQTTNQEVKGTLTLDTESFVRGDANTSGDVTVADAGKVVDYLLGKTTLTPIQEKAADANKSGDVTVADAGKIVDYLLGKTTIEQ